MSPERAPEQPQVLLLRLGQRAAGIILAIVLCVVVNGCAGNNSSAEDQNLPRLKGGEHADLDISRAPPTPITDVIELEVGFAMRNKAEFDQLMAQMQDRSSPQYHHWLTPDQMHERFGETRAQFDAVQQWLTSQGFTITDKAYNQNEDYIRFKGTVAQVQQTFKVRLFSPIYDRYMTNDDPAIPPQFVGVISSVTGFAGLLQPGQ
jgi:subtilase family serine protease